MIVIHSMEYPGHLCTLLNMQHYFSVQSLSCVQLFVTSWTAMINHKLIFTCFCGGSIHPIFRSLSERITLYLVIDLLCLWEEVSSGSSYMTTKRLLNVEATLHLWNKFYFIILFIYYLFC